MKKQSITFWLSSRGIEVPVPANVRTSVLARGLRRDALCMSIGFAIACAQMRAELMATQTWLEDEVAALRKELRGYPR